MSNEAFLGYCSNELVDGVSFLVVHLEMQFIERNYHGLKM